MSLSDDIQRAVTKARQDWADAEHDIRELQRRIELAADARDAADAEGEQALKAARAIGLVLVEAPLSSRPVHELSRDWGAEA